MSTFLQDYLSAADEYEQTWKAADETLYQLCAKYPGHDKVDGVNAKLWIIGRTYATGIERNVRSNSRQGSSMMQVAAHFAENQSLIDGFIGKLPQDAAPLTPENLCTIVAVHGEFVELIGKITRNGNCTRSFVSKYLHFHRPIVPLYDSVAARTLPSFVRWKPDLVCFETPKRVDKEYMWHAIRFLRLYEQLRAEVEADAQTRGRFNVKYVDYFLLWSADQWAKTKGARADTLRQTGQEGTNAAG